MYDRKVREEVETVTGMKRKVEAKRSKEKSSHAKLNKVCYSRSQKATAQTTRCDAIRCDAVLFERPHAQVRIYNYRTMTRTSCGNSITFPVEQGGQRNLNVVLLKV